MAEQKKRIIDWDETTGYGTNDYLLMEQYDSTKQEYDTRKIKASRVGGGKVAELSQADYEHLSESQKKDGTVYMVQDNSTSLIELTEPQTSTSTKVTASSYMVDTHLRQYHYPWAAFNRVSPTTWEYPTPGVTSGTAWSPDISIDGSNSWIQYYFETPVRMTMMTVWAFADYSGSTTKSFIIEGSNDGTTWTNILASGEESCDITASLHQNYINEIPLDSTDSYAYVRLRSLEPMGASYQPTMFIDEIFVYGYGKPVNRIYYMDTEYANTEVNGSSSYQMDTLFSADSYQENITLAHPYTDYDMLVIEGTIELNNKLYKTSTTYVTASININDLIGSYSDGSVAWYKVIDTTNLSNAGRLDVYITNIYGIKF